MLVIMVVVNLFSFMSVRFTVLVTVAQADKKHQQKAGQNRNKLDNTFPDR